jgi:hypothetical protein
MRQSYFDKAFCQTFALTIDNGRLKVMDMKYELLSTETTVQPLAMAIGNWQLAVGSLTASSENGKNTSFLNGLSHFHFSFWIPVMQ